MYNNQLVEKYAKRLEVEIDFFDQSLPLEFCIAYRRRNLIYGRKIYNDLVQSRNDCLSNGYLEFEIDHVMRLYFSEYVDGDWAIACFLDIFVRSNYQIMERLKTLRAQDDLHQYIVSGGNFFQVRSFAKRLSEELYIYRNRMVCGDDLHWEWIFRRFLEYALRLDKQDLSAGLDIFMDIIYNINSIAERSGYNFEASRVNISENFWTKIIREWRCRKYAGRERNFKLKVKKFLLNEW